MLTGIVKWFDPVKGYGVLESPGKGEFFMHANHLISDPANIKKGSVVIFSESLQKKSSKNSAEKCTLIAESGNLDAAMVFLGQDAQVSIEVTVKGKSRHGNPFQRKETRSVSVLEYAMKQLLRGLTEEDLVEKITAYFDSRLDKNYFVFYCEAIEVCLSELLGNEAAKISLERIFNYFGENLDEKILFLCWKGKKFRYIAYNGFEDYEIPEEVLLQNINEIGFKELQRIQSYSYAEPLTAAIVSSHFGKLQEHDIKDLLSLYPVLDFASDEKDKFKEQLDGALAAKAILTIIGKAEELPIINDDQGFSRYFALRHEIPRQLEDSHTASIEDKINQIICSKAAPGYRPVLWLKGLIKDLPANEKMSYFLSQETSAERKTQTLKQMESAEQISALKTLSKLTGPSEVYRLLERYLVAANSFYEYNLPEILFNETFWVNKQGAELVAAFKTFVEETASPEQKYDLFFSGYYNGIPLEILIKDARNLPPDKFKKAISAINDEDDLIIKLLVERVSETESSDVAWIVQLGKQTLKKPAHEFFSRHLFDIVAEDEYFLLWEGGLAVVVPEQQINKVLNDDCGDKGQQFAQPDTELQ